MADTEITNGPLSLSDVVTNFRIASDKFDELAALFKALMDQTDEYSHTRHLARLGFDVAMDYGNQAGCWGEQAAKGGIERPPIPKS